MVMLNIVLPLNCLATQGDKMDTCKKQPEGEKIGLGLSVVWQLADIITFAFSGKVNQRL